MADLSYLKQHYEGLATNELLRLRSTQLTDEALTILDAELAARLADVDTAERTYRAESAARQVHSSALASIGARFFAKFIDFVGALVVFGVFNYLCFLYMPRALSDAIGYGSILVFLLYLLFQDGFSGQSVGKRILEIRVIENATGEPCSLPRSFVRNLLCSLGILDGAFALGSSRQRLGDLAAGTSVVRVEARRMRRPDF